MAMKKTLMAGMVALCAMSGMNAAQAAAATSGTQTFKANITDTTCTITGLNQRVELGSLSTTYINSLPRWGGIRNDELHFNILGCPTALKTANVTLTSSGEYSLGLAVQPFATTKPEGSTEPDSAYIWKSGAVKSFPLANGGVDIPLTLWTSRYRSETATPGTYQQVMSFTFDFA
ncbi:type 1 fimbrial protein [Salmonella enterica]|nr:type 1 fimbrial protein [Salmonella enterica]EDJ9072679.1 hypothetical protein [Salmonella enterica subsp. enterica serovar Typhimurium]